MTARVAWLAALGIVLSMPVLARPSPEAIAADYRTVDSQLKAHVAHDQWIDDASQSPRLLARRWTLLSEWVAAWLDVHRSATPAELQSALRVFDPSGDGEGFQCLALDDGALLVATPAPFGNVFIVTRSQDGARVAWTIASPQRTRRTEAEILAAWRPENAREGGRGPYWAASGRAGPVSPRLGILPKDRAGHSRFWIDGIYAQGAGGTVGAQTSLWIWNGTTARLLAAKNYEVYLDQSVQTRFEGGVLKVQQKKDFRAFSACGQCEGRQVDWIVRVGGAGVTVLGEKSAVPELDIVDELFFRRMHGRSADDIASQSAIEAADAIVHDARGDMSEKDWRNFRTLGLMGSWVTKPMADGVKLCFDADESGPNIYLLKRHRNSFFVDEITRSEAACEPSTHS